MILEKLHLDKESRQERRTQRQINIQADAIAEAIAYGKYEEQEYKFNIGRTPNNMTVMSYAKEVAEQAIGPAMQHYTPYHLAEYDQINTALENAGKAGVGSEGLDTLPPPNRDVTLALGRTTVAKVYNF